MEADDLARRIMFDISVVLKRQPNLDEFDIIPVTESQNKSPVIHLDTKMALEAWCVKLLYLHVHSNLIRWRERRAKADDDKVVQWSEVALLLNPEVTTFWNVRKELLCREKILQSEDLRLCTLILTRKPKSPEVFAHRRWLVKKALSTLTSGEPTLDAPPPSREEMLKNELLLCNVAASRYPNNYSAWSHRQWVHDNVVAVAGNDSDVMINLLKDLKWSEEWVQRNVSDHSGLQFRQYLLTRISKLNLHASGGIDERSTSMSSRENRASVAEMFGVESDFTRRLICDFPGHETLWYHCRFVAQSCRAFGISQRVSVDGSAAGPTTCKKTKIDAIPLPPPTMTTSQRTDAVVETDFRFNLNDEILFADKMSTDDNGGDVQSNLATAHRKWLSQIFGPFTSS